MLSMTGFGSGQAERDGNRAIVEIAAVNSRKQADIRLLLSREWASLEPTLRKRVLDQVARGNLTVSVTVELNTATQAQRFRFDENVAAYALRFLKKLATETGISPDIRIGELLAVPGVVSELAQPSMDGIDSLVLNALDTALAELRDMQQREGDTLRADLLARHLHLGEILAKIRSNSDNVLKAWRTRLHERVRALGLELALDDERLAKEVVFYAERSDITEEIVRLQSHLDQFRDLLNSTEPVGRTLEFLCQEMHREINTIAAKTTDTDTSNIALTLKSEIGRIREQIQNVA